MTDAGRTRRHTLGRLIRNALLIALPFGLFYGLFTSAIPYWKSFLMMYGIAVVIGLSIGSLAILLRLLLNRCGFGEYPTSRRGLIGSIFLFYVIGVTGSQVPLILVSFLTPVHIYEGWRSTLISIGFSFVFTTLFLGLSYSRSFYKQLVEKEKAAERARTEIARAELRALRAQIHPHFLFNTLNTIAALIREEPDVAEHVTTRLAEVFRFALRASERDWIPLWEEIEFVQAYVDIERVRLGERLVVEEDVAPAARDVLVPSLLLQPLVENAIRHGIAPRSGGGRVRVIARADGELLTLVVEDDGVGFDTATRGGRLGEGFGLRSAEERVRAIGHGARADVESHPGRGTRITLTLPVHPPTLTPD